MFKTYVLKDKEEKPIQHYYIKSTDDIFNHLTLNEYKKGF